MLRLPWLVIALVLAVVACSSRPPEEPSPAAAGGEEPAGTPVASALAPVADAAYGEVGGVSFVRVPADECTNITATPTLVGEWLLYPSHERRECKRAGFDGGYLYAFSIDEGRLYVAYEGAEGEAPLTYDAAHGLVYWPVTFGGNLIILDAETLAVREKVSLGTTADSSGVVVGDTFFVGTVNTPDPACQDPLNAACGSLVAVQEDEVVARLDFDDGFRAWVGTGVTSDGEYLYWGTAAQTVGAKSGDESEYLYGCSVVKTDRQLRVLASFDPGELGCHELPFEGANMDSVSGEVVPDGTGLWVQFVRPNGSEMVSALYRLDLDLREVCRVEFPFAPAWQAVGFYGAPTVDEEGFAYVSVTVPWTKDQPRGELWRVGPDCSAERLFGVEGAWAQASPTLVEGAVLFATDGALLLLDRHGTVLREVELASSARVLSSPVVVGGVVYVLQEDGTLNVIPGLGIGGYGDAIWPRYRHDNAGSATLGSARAAASAPGGANASGPAAAFIAFHLEVPQNPRAVAIRWPALERFIELADEYGVKVTLQFSWPWAEYVYGNGLLPTVHAWEANGHEIAIHHHGPSHTFFDGYTDAPELIGSTPYATSAQYRGTMSDLMEFLGPLSQRGITSAGMSDEETDWPAGVLYLATDSGDSPSKDDLLSRPVERVYNGQRVIEVYNAGYEIDHLGEEKATLADVAAAIDAAAPDQYLGIVFNDETITKDFDLIEPLFELLRERGVQVRTVSELLGGR